MTATDQRHTYKAYDSGDRIAIYDSTAEAKNYLVGVIVHLFPTDEAVERVITVNRHFESIDTSDLDAIRAAREEYRRQIDEYRRQIAELREHP